MDDARRILAALTPIIGRMRPEDSNHNGAVAFAAGAIWRMNLAELAPGYRSLAACEDDWVEGRSEAALRPGRK